MPWKFPTKISFRSAQFESGWRKVLQQCSRRIRQEQWEVVHNETVTIHSTGLASKPIILESQSGVCFPAVFWDVGRRSVPRWEDDVEDVSAKGLRSRQVEAWALVLAVVIASATMRVVAAASLLPLIAAGIQGVARVMVEVETLMHRDLGTQPAALLRVVD